MLAHHTHSKTAQVIPMPKARLPHEFAPVGPETLREAEDLRRYGGDPVRVDAAGRAFLVNMPMRASKIPLADRVSCADYVDAGVERFGVQTVVRALCAVLAANNIDVVGMTLDELAQGEEQQ